MSDLFSVSGKVVVVTGGSSGIGLMIARGFVEGGAKVYIASRKKEACDQVAADLSQIGSCVAVPADLSTEDGAKALAAAVSEHESKLDVLVNNAGANWGAPFDEFPDAAWDKVLALNVKAIFHLTRQLRPLLTAAATAEDPARVINIGSVDGIRVPELDVYAYAASKAGVHHLTRMLAKRFAAEHITVNAVAPGPFQSKMMKQTLEDFGEIITSNVPLSRIGTDDDMAGVAIYLASRAGAFVTGTVIPVDGGITGCA